MQSMKRDVSDVACEHDEVDAAASRTVKAPVLASVLDTAGSVSGQESLRM